MHADVLDYFYMIFGLLGSIGDGIMTPLVLFITSKIMNSLGNASGTSNNNFVHNINEVLTLLSLSY
jgi:ATP-binding cassette subfamily B (MDR/TAP) protein 1